MKSSRSNNNRINPVAKPKPLNDEHPEADIRHIVRGVVRRDLKPVSQKKAE